MTAKFTKFDNSSNWVDGEVGKYKFQAKLFDTPSDYGINDGRVSKLCIWDDDVRLQKFDILEASVVNFDRGWDIEPTEEVKPYFDAVMELLENSSLRFV